MTLMSKYPIDALDERDRQILADRVASLDAIAGPRVGDWVIFADGTERRISHRWFFPADEDGPEIDNVQTSHPGGSFYLGDGYVSFSGSLFLGVPGSTLTLTDELRPAGVWFFHHDWWQAHNGVGAEVMFRVFTCSLEATR